MLRRLLMRIYNGRSPPAVFGINALATHFTSAAGSGCLTHFWKSSRKPKGASGGITNDDDAEYSGSSGHSTETRKCQYVPSSKRRSAKRRFHHKWRCPKLSEGGGTVVDGWLTTDFQNPPLDDSESWGVLALHNNVGADACSCPSTPKHSERSHDAALGYPTSGINSSSRCPVGSTFNALCPQNCYEFICDGNKVSSNSTGAFSQIFKEGSKEARKYSLCGAGFPLKGKNLSNMLLFNFGVGVGMIVGMLFAIMSNKHVSRQIIEQLEEVMSALKSLEGEIQGRRKLRLGNKDRGDARDYISLEQSPSVLQKVCRLVEQVRISMVENFASVTDCHCSQERARLEAELEAELERMELDLKCKDTELSRQPSCANEDDLGVGCILQDDLSTRHFPCDIDVHSSSINGNKFSRALINYGDSAVPPAELAKRLYEVLETRQGQKIIELEAEIKRLDNGLQVKEQQCQAWKQRVYNLLQETACPSCQKDLYVEVENTSVKNVSSTTSIEDLFVARLERPVPLFPNNEDPLSNPVDNVHSTYSSTSQVRICHGNDSYDKACEGWLLPLNDTGSGSPRQLHIGLLDDTDKRELRSRLSMTTTEPEVMDVFYGSVSSCSSNNAVMDILGSASCSRTSMDRAQESHNNHLRSDVELTTSNEQEFFGVEWDSRSYPEIICPSQDICGQDIIDIHESSGQCGWILEWNSSEDSCNSSDSDEELGQMLIERIVQKGREGVLMVEAAKSIMASLDLDDTSLDKGIPSC
ncbi:hypothetical protein GOP47_0020038 [Adiantum capillus-veneris]|uniref:Uncharacterized protein n=1 Tax=Adiantum capillus-veneris TaxID=13818 RepID=A0A9D4UD64_ADICA|nr:hypothetical protein GOP47_0020038 [Adiantum capillus-veneris]